MNDPWAIVLVIAVTVGLSGLLRLTFRAGNRLEAYLRGKSRPFSTRYLPALAERHRRGKLLGVDDADDSPPRAPRPLYTTVREAGTRAQGGPRLHWSEIFPLGPRRLVILGSPGAGKSSLLDGLILRLTTPSVSLPGRLGPWRLPLFARLGELRPAGADSLPALLAREVPLQKVPAGFPARVLRKGGCLVLLDGLDEVAQEHRGWAIEEIERLVGAHPDNDYVVTCRTSAWQRQLPGFRVYEIAPFTREDSRRFVGGWYSEELRARNLHRLGAKPSPAQRRSAESAALVEAAARTGELWQTLVAQADLLRVADTPLLLSLILLAYDRRPADLLAAVMALVEELPLGADLRAEVRSRLLVRPSPEAMEELFGRLAADLNAADLDGARRVAEESLRGSGPLRWERMLELLSGLGAASVPPLAAVVLPLAGEGEDPDVRIRALRALARLRVPLDADVRQVLERARREREPGLKNAAAWAWCELGGAEDLGLVKVPAGEFLIGSFGEGDRYDHRLGRPQHLLYLPSFYIGRHLVTVSHYSEFLAASGHQLAKNHRFHQLNRHADHPVVGLRWVDAWEYARWHGLTLPSEAEWEKAARGVDGRRYPWGNEWQGKYANTLASWPSRGRSATTPVGSFSPRGDSPYGCSDMAGNALELTRTYLDNQSYPYDPADGREALHPEDIWHGLRGGAADQDPRDARCAVRQWEDFRESPKFVGFRVLLAEPR